MNHNVFRQIGLRLGVLGAIFGILTLIAFFMGLPQPWVWAAMFTMLSWTTVVRNLI
ncbi:hypothetical protein SAMN04487969_1559 [Paenibacillus algorifonticola]|uniref:Uncharacterized protein n=1 Tax=Paenibacillus algorifonticola TaxID=684063 RepID=A0A1I2J3W1_9BACL|nr:hypothetical protein [Paenibacillus algorifonticola]SFF49375.1 hypothetical protein SAMN04487969_1559 [Paenibacillus algorifonticola]